MGMDSFELLWREADRMRNLIDAADPSAFRALREQQRVRDALMGPLALDLDARLSLIDEVAGSSIVEILKGAYDAAQRSLVPDALAEYLAKAAISSPAQALGLVGSTSVVHSAAASLRDIEDMLTRHREALSLDSWRGALAVGSTFEALRRQFEEIARRVAPDMSSITEQARLLQFAGPGVQESLLALDRAESPEDGEQLVRQVIEAMAAWVRTLPPSAISARVANEVLRIVLSVLIGYTFYLWASRDDARRHELEDERHEAQLEWQDITSGRLDELVGAVVRLAPPVSPNPVYEVTSSLPFRVAPHRDGRWLGRIPGGAIVEQIGRHGNWLRVVHFNLRTGVPETGWIYKRCLVQIESEGLDEPRGDVDDSGRLRAQRECGAGDTDPAPAVR